jgi:hypothetical protein
MCTLCAEHTKSFMLVYFACNVGYNVCHRKEQIQLLSTVAEASLIVLIRQQINSESNAVARHSHVQPGETYGGIIIFFAK